MINLDLNNATVAGSYNNYTPIPKGQYRVIISEATIDDGYSGAGSKNPNTHRVILKLKFDVFGAAEDGGSRTMLDMIMYQYDSNLPKHTGMIEQNKAKLTDLLLQIIAVRYNGNPTESPFTNGFGEHNVASLVDSNTVLTLDIGINKQGENEVKSYYPESEQEQGQQPQNQPQQQPQNHNGQQNPNMGNAQPQQNNSANVAAYPNQNVSHSNRPAFMQRNNR